MSNRYYEVTIRVAIEDIDEAPVAWDWEEVTEGPAYFVKETEITKKMYEEKLDH